MLETGCDIGLLGLREALWQLMGGEVVRFTYLRLCLPQNGCFKAGKAEIIFIHPGFRESEGVRVAFFGRFGYGRAAGVGQAEHLGDLIKCFADGIVMGLAEDGVIEVVAEQRQLAMAAGYNDG